MLPNREDFRHIRVRLAEFAYWRPLTIGTTFLLVLFGLTYLIPLPWNNFEEFVVVLEELYASYGYWVVFLGTLIEGLFLLSWYFPGSTMVLLAAAFARDGVLDLNIIFTLAILGFFVSYNVNYLLGRYGWYKALSVIGAQQALNQARARLEKHRWKAIFAGYISPGTAVLFSTSSGILRLPYLQYALVSLLAIVFWTVLWGSLAYLIGLPLLKFISRYWWVWTVPLVAWFVWTLTRGK